MDIVNIGEASLPLKHRVLTHGIKLVDKNDAENALIIDIVENYPVYNMDHEYLCDLWPREDPRIDKKPITKKA